MGHRKNNEHDLGYKKVFSHKETFLEFLRDFVKKDWAKHIREEDLVLIDKEFILEDFKEEEADIIYKVNVSGNDVIFYVLLELQSKVDFQMPIRLLMYMTEVWRDELRNTEKKVRKNKNFKLPAILPIVLYNGKNNWTAVRSFKEVLSNYELFEENIVDFKYMLFDINKIDKEELVEIADLVSVIFLLDQDIEIEEIIERLRFIGKLLSRKASKEQIKIFRSWIINIFKNRFDNEIVEHIKSVLVETSELEMSDMVSNLGRKLEEEFKSREEKGVEKGVEKGAILSRREDILDNLNEIATVSEELAKRINLEENIETLKKWVKLSARVESLEDFINKMN